MKRIVPALLLALSMPGLAGGQEAPSPGPAFPEAAPADRMTEGEDLKKGLMERGMKLFMRGLMQEMEPALRDMEDMASEWGPAIGGLLGLVDDFTNYHPPEILPNGDIIIRRKRPDEMPSPEGEEIEL